MATRKTNTTARGLGYRHRQQVDMLKRRHLEGAPCWWCGEPMYLAEGLAGDHSVPRSQGGQLADRLLHGLCNSQRGDGMYDDQRPALKGKQVERTARTGLTFTRLAMPWLPVAQPSDQR